MVTCGSCVDCGVADLAVEVAICRGGVVEVTARSEVGGEDEEQEEIVSLEREKEFN